MRRKPCANASSTATLFAVLGATPAFPANLIVDEDGQGGLNNCDSANVTPYTTIQAALTAAAPGDTIVVCPGVYDEQPVVDKAVRISGRGEAIVRPSPMADNTTSLTTGNPIAAGVLVADTSGAVVEGIAVDGTDNGGAGCNRNPVGIFFRNASGTVQNAAVRNMKLGAGLEGCQAGLGILIQSGPEATSAVVVQDTTVHGYQKNGLTASGAGTTLTARHNHITGFGPTPHIAQNGIQVSGGASGTVEDNAVANHVWTGCQPGSCTFVAANMLMFEAGVGLTVRNNTVTNAQAGIYFSGVNEGTIQGNNVIQTLVADGMIVDGTSNTVLSNHVSDSAEAGIFVSGDGNILRRNRINEAPIGIWNFEGTNTAPVTGVQRNTFFNVATPVLTGDLPGGRRRASCARGIGFSLSLTSRNRGQGASGV